MNFEPFGGPYRAWKDAHDGKPVVPNYLPDAIGCEPRDDEDRQHRAASRRHALQWAVMSGSSIETAKDAALYVANRSRAWIGLPPLEGPL